MLNKTIVLAAYFVLTASMICAAPADTSVSLEKAIADSGRRVETALGAGTRVAVIDCRSDSRALSDYIIQELTAYLVNSGKLVVIERTDLQNIRDEITFQLSGEVSDESLVTIGNMLGAEVLVTCSVDETAMLRVKAVSVETTQVLVLHSIAVSTHGTYEQLGGRFPDRHTITVSTAEEFIQAIGPDRVIRMRPGLYDLTNGHSIRNRYISWIDEYDGPCPVIRSVSNLAIIGESGVEIVIEPAYGWVLSFDTCSTIQLSDLVIGHSTPGYCMGGVLRFTNCSRIDIRHCDLYGSGTYGVTLENSSQFRMEYSVIRECTYGLLTIENSRDIAFWGTLFKTSGEFDLIGISRSDNVSFDNCDFLANTGSHFFSIDYTSRYLAVNNSRFENNQARQLVNQPARISFTNTVFANNSFDLQTKP